jgi:hypothetical protein
LQFHYKGLSLTSGLTDQPSTFTSAGAPDDRPAAPDPADRSADDSDVDPQLAVDESESAEDALPGRIYLRVHLGIPAEAGIDPVWGVIGVDPNTGKWELVSGARPPSLRVLAGGKKAIFSLNDQSLDQNRLVLFDMETKTSQDLGEYWSAIPSRDGKMAIVRQASFPEPDGPGLSIATGFKQWRLDLTTLEKQPLGIPNDHMLLDASGDLEWCLMLRTMVEPDDPQSIIQRIILVKTDGTQESPLLPEDGASHAFACFAPNGEKIALVSRSPDQGSSIQLVDFDGENARTLYQPKEMDHSPSSLCWSPDGRKLLTIIGDYTEGEHDDRLLIIDANSGAQREIILNDAQALSLRYANWQ